MADMDVAGFQRQLLDRRERLETVRAADPGLADIGRLLDEVDAALARIGAGTFGLCEECHDPVEPDRLSADPLMRHCLDHLSAEEQREMERDLDLAFQVQSALLPTRGLHAAGWEAHYHYEPAGSLSGDYCDVLGPDAGRNGLLFLAGDVSGKGIASSLLMSHLHAIFRSLSRLDMPIIPIVEHANRVFSESTMPSLYATLACGVATPSGDVRLCNAGHCPPILVSGGAAITLDPTGIPLGLFASSKYSSHSFRMQPGDTLLLYTDGLTEARNRSGADYGPDRLVNLLTRNHAMDLDNLEKCVLSDWNEFREGERRSDDVTLLLLRRSVIN
jgi:phosphoserine phosphatase RsbU/P